MTPEEPLEMLLGRSFEALFRKIVREELKAISTEDRLLTPEQVGEFLGYSVHHVRLLNREKKLRGFMLGDNSLRFRASEVERFVREREQAAA